MTTQQATINRLPWRERAAHSATRILGLERLAGVAGVLRSRLMAERLALKTQDGTLDTTAATPVDKALETLDLRLGDEIHVHQPARRSALPIVGAALLSAGLAGGAGALPWLIPLLSGLAQSAPAPSVDTDTDTQYELHISGGKP